MGQQISAAAAEGQGLYQSPLNSETQSKVDNGDIGRTHQNPAWRTPAATYPTKPETASLTAGENANKTSSKSENDVSRMSIRAAIDSFIENCLSSSNGYSPSDKRYGEGGQGDNDMINGERKMNEDSQNSRTSDTSKASAGSRTESISSESTDVQDNGNDNDDTEEKELVIDCEDKSTVDLEAEEEQSDRKDYTTVLKHVVKQENRDVTENAGDPIQDNKDRLKANSPGVVPETNKQILSPTSSEKKTTFSAFLQDHIKKVGLDKNEELTQFALNKEIQSHGQIIMWEMAKKPVPDVSVVGPSASSLPAGPVKLQTLIDKVLDNSLNNQELVSSPYLNKLKQEEVSHVTQEMDKSDSRELLKSIKESSKEAVQKDNISSIGTVTSEQESSIIKDKSESVQPARSTLCFKDHIEKVLLESFLSYEEEERKEAIKRGDNPDEVKSPPLIATDSERQNAKRDLAKSGVDGTISVQDIVDRVISQTEVISKLLTPTTECSKQADVQSAAAALPNPPMKYQNISASSKALLEAQRHTVHKEHLSIANNIGRKRGRPRLGSPMNSSWVISDSAKDIKPGYHDQRSREFRNTQMPPGSHQVPSVSHQGSLGSHQGLPGSHQGSPGSHQIPPGSHQMPNHQDRSALHQRSAGPPPLDYAPHGPHPYNIPGLTALMVSKPSTPQSPAMYQQRHHPGQQRQQPSGQSPTATSSVSLSTSSSTVYQDPFHSRGASHLPQQHRPVHTVGTKAPPPLILADHIGDNVAPGNTRLVPHIPTKSCLCHSCVSHFSHEKSPSQPPPQPHHLRHPGTKQDRGNEQSPHPHPSHYHPYQTPSSRRNSKDYYPHQVPPNGESLRPVVAVSGQSLPPQAIMPSYVAAHRQHDVQPGSQSQRDVPGRYYEHKSRNPSPGHYPVYPSQNIVAKPLPVDSRYVEADRHASRHPHMADIVPYEIVDSRRLPAPPRAKAPSQPLALDTAKLVVPHHPPIIHIPAESAGQSEGEQPLDLSVKPTPAHSRDTRRKTNDSTTEQHPRHDLFTEPYRSMHPEHSTPRNQVHGQYVEYDQRGPAGHHLQRLENSVDRFLPQSSPHPHPQSSPHPQMQSSPHPQMQSSPHPHMQSSPHPLMQSSPHPHMQSSPHPHMQSSPHIQARFKLSPLPSPQHQDIRGGTQDRHSGLPRSSPLLQPPESPNHRGAPSNMHPAQSPVGGYQGSLPISSASQQPSHLRTVSASPNHTYHSLSPGGHHRPESPPTPHQYGVSHKHSDPAVGSSYQRPSSHGSEQDSRTAPSMIQPARPQNSESPDDQDSQRLGVSKHEPIQNIIGSHPPSDILYLICRLCRQTYGSPYGFRKHFRNQHGFEPKAEHTIVQTISATKTAMAHTGPLDHQTHSAALEQMDKVMLSQSPFDDGNVYEDGQYHGQRRDHNISHTSQSAGNPFAYDDMKQDVVKRDVQENKLLECPECGHTFQLNDFGSYKRHCRQHSLHRSSGPFACHDCQKSFPEPGLLQEHLDTHSNFTASECGICRTFFSSPSYLAEHLQAAHGHVYHADGDKDTPDNPRRSSDDHPRKFESSDGGNIKRSSSFSGTSITPSPASHARSPLPPRSHTRSPLPHGPNYSPTVPSPAAPAGHSVSMSKRHRQFPTAEPIMFTVHTPKGLEVQKLPADAVVTTASPDSSYDEAKVDTQPSESLTQNVGTSQDISTRETDAAREKSCLESNVSSKSAVLSKPSSSEGQKPLMKDETESNSSDCCLSVESNSHSVEGSRASSPGLEDVEKFYKHKKYSRHRKRVNSEDLNETDGKVSKVEGSNPSRNDQSPFSVSSSINSGVTFRDCESSGQLSEDSNNSFKSREDGRKQEEKGAMGQEKNCTDHSGSKSKGSDIDDTKLGELSKKPGDSGNKFKWDRLTRSQAGKASQSVSYTSS